MEHTLKKNDPTPAWGGISAEQKAPSLSQLLIVFGAALGLCVGFAPVFFGTISIFLKPVADEFDWGRAQASGATVFSMLGAAFGAIAVGNLIDRFGPPRVIISSVIATTALVALLSKIGNSPALFTTLSFSIGFVGAGTTPPGYLSVLARCFDKRLGLALGFAGIGMGVGTILMPMLASHLIVSQGWRQAYVSLAMLSGATGMLACFILFLRAGNKHQAGVSPTVETSPVKGMTAREAIRSRNFWLLLGVVMAVAVSSLGVVIHFVAMLTDRGVDAHMAAKAVAISGAGVVIGRVACDYMLDRYHAPMIAAGAFFLAAIGVVLLLNGQEVEFAWFALSGLFIGFALGAEGDFLPFFVRKYFGLKAFGSIYGMLFFAHGIGGVLGPVLFGLAFDHLNDYSFALWGAASLLCMAAAAVVFMGRYREFGDKQ